MLQIRELIGGECKAPSTGGVVPPPRIDNATIVFERPADAEDLVVTDH